MAKKDKPINPLRIEETGTLGRFFPPDDPLSPLMYRLAIIRDDIAFEMRSIGLKQEDETSEVWRCTYFIRKASLTIHEAAKVMEQEVQTFANRKRAASPRLTAAVAKARETIVAIRDVVAPMRDSLGAHIQPNWADQERDPSLPGAGEMMLKTHASEEASIRVDFQDPQRTNFHGATRLAILAISPDATGLDEALKTQRSLADAILMGARTLIGTIPMVLATWWTDIGVIDVPEGVDLTLKVPKGWPHNVDMRVPRPGGDGDEGGA